MANRIVRFGVFELKPETGELWKHGVRVRLQTKPLQVLEALIAEPGEVVTREELFKKLWSTGTFVDFESGLNTATNRLRAALGDSADAPRYIETLPRLGYRFICPVSEKIPGAPVQQPTPPAGPAPGLSESAAATKKMAGRYQAAAAVLLVVAVILLLVYVRSKGWNRGHLQPAVQTEAGHGFGPRSALSYTRDARASKVN